MTSFKKFYSKNRDRSISREYERMKNEFFSDLEFDYQKHLQESFHDNQSESNSEITYTLKQKNTSEKHNVDELFKQYRKIKLYFEKLQDT